jgi:hypothetical protein
VRCSAVPALAKKRAEDISADADERS